MNTIWYHLFGRGLVTSLDDLARVRNIPRTPSYWTGSHRLRQKRLEAQARDQGNRDVGDLSPVGGGRARTCPMIPEIRCCPPESGSRRGRDRQRHPLGAAGLLPTSWEGPGLSSDPRGGSGCLGRTPVRRLADATGADRYRRGVYTFHKRSVLLPRTCRFSMAIGSAQRSLVERGPNTPLQALTDPEQRGVLRGRAGTCRRVQPEKPGNLTDQLTWRFVLPPVACQSPRRRHSCETLYNERSSLYAASPATRSSRGHLTCRRAWPPPTQRHGSSPPGHPESRRAH